MQLDVWLRVSLLCIVLSFAVRANASSKILPVLMLKLPLNKGLGLHLRCCGSNPLPWQPISLQPPFLSTRSYTEGVMSW